MSSGMVRVPGSKAWVPGVAGSPAVPVRSMTDSPTPRSRDFTIPNVIEKSLNSTAARVVAFDSRVADPRGPNAVCEPMPPNAPARSAALPLCSSTTMIKKSETMT